MNIAEILKDAPKGTNLYSPIFGDVILNKEEYSIFENKTDGFTLYKEIRELIKEGEFDISVCGIAGDYCVLETIKGLRKYIGDSYITVLFEYIASIDGGKKLKEYISF